MASARWTTGVRLLPLTDMLIVASPLSGALINRLGPRIPLVGGMALAAVALFGLSRIGAFVVAERSAGSRCSVSS